MRPGPRCALEPAPPTPRHGAARHGHSCGVPVPPRGRRGDGNAKTWFDVLTTLSLSKGKDAEEETKKREPQRAQRMPFGKLRAGKGKDAPQRHRAHREQRKNKSVRRKTGTRDTQRAQRTTREEEYGKADGNDGEPESTEDNRAPRVVRRPIEPRTHRGHREPGETDRVKPKDVALFS